jgi:hypothetical protein
MAERGVDPFSHPCFIEALRVQLIPEMAVYVVDDRHQEKDTEVGNMYGNGEVEDHGNALLHQRFQRVKCICRPWRRIGGLMMYQVKPPEQHPVMHKAVHEIKIGIVQNEQHRKQQEVISISILPDIPVPGSIWRNLWMMQENNNETCNTDGCQGKTDLPHIIFISGKPLLYFPVEKFTSQYYIKYKKSNGRYGKIPAAYQVQYFKV